MSKNRNNEQIVVCGGWGAGVEHSKKVLREIFKNNLGDEFQNPNKLVSKKLIRQPISHEDIFKIEKSLQMKTRDFLKKK